MALLLAGVLGACAGEGTVPPVTTPPAGEAAVDPRFDELRAFVQEEFDREGVVGGSVAIVVDGQLAWSEGFGLRHVDEADPLPSPSSSPRRR